VAGFSETGLVWKIRIDSRLCRWFLSFKIVGWRRGNGLVEGVKKITFA
jgi:hypothetical protein